MSYVIQIIDFGMPCPKCGNYIDAFQSYEVKDNPSKYWEVDYFHGVCFNCKCAVKFIREKKIPKVPLTDYHMEIK